MKKAILSVTLFNFLAAGITFLINIILARLFPYEIFGRINLLLSIIAVSIVAIGYGFNNSLVVYYNQNNTSIIDKGLLNYINRAYVFFLIKIIPLFIGAIFLLNIHYDFSKLEILFLIFGSLLPAIYRYIATIFQALGKWSRYNFLNVSFNFLKGVVLIGGGAVFYLILEKSLDYRTYLLLYLIYTFVLLIFGIGFSYPYLSITSDHTKKNDFKRLVLNLGLTELVIALSMRLDNILIENLLGLKQVAIYSAANSLALVFPLITSSIMRVLMREMSKNSSYYLKKILEIQKKYFLVLILVILAVILVSPYLITFLFGPKYIESIPYFQILIVVYIGGIFFTPLESYFYNEKSKLIFLLKVVQLILLVSSSIILIPYIGLYGVAIAVVLTRIFAWIYLTKLSYKYRNIGSN